MDNPLDHPLVAYLAGRDTAVLVTLAALVAQMTGNGLANVEDLYARMEQHAELARSDDAGAGPDFQRGRLSAFAEVLDLLRLILPRHPPTLQVVKGGGEDADSGGDRPPD